MLRAVRVASCPPFAPQAAARLGGCLRRRAAARAAPHVPDGAVRRAAGAGQPAGGAASSLAHLVQHCPCIRAYRSTGVTCSVDVLCRSRVLCSAASDAETPGALRAGPLQTRNALSPRAGPRSSPLTSAPARPCCCTPCPPPTSSLPCPRPSSRSRSGHSAASPPPPPPPLPPPPRPARAPRPPAPPRPCPLPRCCWTWTPPAAFWI